MYNSKYLDLTPPVMAAVKAGTPIAVIETGFFMQLPYSGSLAALKDCEEALWRRDCVPCFAGVINGRLKAGLLKEEMELLCQSGEVINREGLPGAVAAKSTGAVTAGAALAIAALAGIVPVICPGLSDSASDVAALSRTKRMVFCNRLQRDVRTLYASHGISVLESGYSADSVADAYAVQRELNFDECAVLICGPTLADLAECASSSAIAIKRLNNFN